MRFLEKLYFISDQRYANQITWPSTAKTSQKNGKPKMAAVNIRSYSSLLLEAKTTQLQYKEVQNSA